MMNMSVFLQTAKPRSDGKTGITLRDQFAMAVISGYMATESPLTHESAEWSAKHAYEVADAMLKEREK